MLRMFTIGWMLLGMGMLPNLAHAQASNNPQPQTAAMPQDEVHWQYFEQLEHAGILLLDAKGQALRAKAPQQSFVPASTTKLLTAYLALQHWGEDYRFKTDFFLTPAPSVGVEPVNPSHAPILWVKGYGDPFLVSEELVLIAKAIAQNLRQQGVQALAGIRLDTRFYASDLVMPGTGESDNPYDAIPSALAANFNTLYIEKRGETLLSAEPQTPLTPMGLQIAKEISHFKKTTKGVFQRVNLGGDVKRAESYFAQLLAFFIRAQGVAVGDILEWQALPMPLDDIKPLYRHENSRTLGDMVGPMMQFSTNFIANQLALNLSVEALGAPATQSKVAATYRHNLHKLFGWQQFHIEDGAGLSRNNRLTPQQLIDVLERFRPWRDLLPEVSDGVFAKSGSLIGVSALAGYMRQDDAWLPFAFMINQTVPYHFRFDLAEELSQGL